MAAIDMLFATRIYRAELDDEALIAELGMACRVAAEDDAAGRAWSRKHGYPGYTSYASLDDLPWRFPAFKSLVRALDRHAATFAKLQEWDLGKRRLALAGLWINVLPEGGQHGSHLHPNAVVSGTVYVAVPPGAAAIRFEDPRLAHMMAAPPRKAKAARDLLPFVSVTPEPGTLLLWESFVRHEVPLNRAAEPRISVSFNYARG